VPAHNEGIKFAKGEWETEIFRRRRRSSLQQSELLARSNLLATRIAGAEADVWERMAPDLEFWKPASEGSSTL
jgi:hypothetical protein